jgi:PD-(D/E)XK nuclease superfamily
MFPEVLDSSMLAEFKACPAKFYLSYIQEWKSKSVNTHLHAGGAFARGLEVARRGFYEQDLPAEDCEALGVQSLLQFYGDHQPPNYGSAANKTALRMAGALEFYFSRYPLNHQTAYPILMPGGKRGIEFSFAHNLPILHPETGQPLQYCGRADGIFQFAGGTYIFDEKTASQLGATWAKQWKLRAQFSGYAWAARESGIKVDGVVVRGVSILKGGYDILEDISFRTEYMIGSWYSELLDWIDQMLHCYKTNRWRHTYDHACSDFGGCQFQDICDMEDQVPWLERGFERKHWDPITRKETPLEGPK